MLVVQVLPKGQIQDLLGLVILRLVGPVIEQLGATQNPVKCLNPQE